MDVNIKRIKFNGSTYWIDNTNKRYIYKYPGMDPIYFYFDEMAGKEITEGGIII